MRGMSMHDSRILEGGLLAVHRNSEACSGQTVLRALAKRSSASGLKRRGNQVQLLPGNPDFSPIVRNLKRDSLVIEGIGVGVIRNDRAL
jgi:repressor LexA